MIFLFLFPFPIFLLSFFLFIFLHLFSLLSCIYPIVFCIYRIVPSHFTPLKEEERKGEKVKAQKGIRRRKMIKASGQRGMGERRGEESFDKRLIDALNMFILAIRSDHYYRCYLFRSGFQERRDRTVSLFS